MCCILFIDSCQTFRQNSQQHLEQHLLKVLFRTSCIQLPQGSGVIVVDKYYHFALSLLLCFCISEQNKTYSNNISLNYLELLKIIERQRSEITLIWSFFLNTWEKSLCYVKCSKSQRTYCSTYKINVVAISYKKMTPACQYLFHTYVVLN